MREIRTVTAAVPWAAAAAVSFTGLSLASDRALVGRQSMVKVLLISNTVAAVAAGALAVCTRRPSFDTEAMLWAVACGVSTLLALALWLLSLRFERLGIVTAVASTEGVIVALLSAASGTALGPLAGAGIAVVLVGAFLLRPSERAGALKTSGVGLLLALASAFLFAVSLIAADRAHALGSLYVVAMSRLAMLPLLAGAIVLTGAPSLSASALRWTIAVGVLTVASLATFIAAADHNLAVAGVVTSQYAALTALLAVVLLGERLSSVQVGGIACGLLGVALVAAG